MCSRTRRRKAQGDKTRSWEVDDVAALLLLPLKLIWAEVQDSVCEPGAARTWGPTKRGEQDETLRVTDAYGWK